GVDRRAERDAVVVVAEHRHREVLERRAGPLPRVLEQVSGVDPALDDAVAHLGPRQLHDHVGRSGGERPEVHRVGGRDLLGGVPAGGPAAHADAVVGHPTHTAENTIAGQNTTDPTNRISHSGPVARSWSRCHAVQTSPISAYGAARMSAVPIHSAMVISKLRTFFTAGSMPSSRSSDGPYVNADSHPFGAFGKTALQHGA